jgi:phosphatidylinositol alpha-1,6-mannosyltransferase
VELLGEHRIDDLRPGTRRTAWAAQLLIHQRRLVRARPEVVFADRLYFAPYALLAAALVRPRPRMVLWLHGSEVSSRNQLRLKAPVLRRFDSLICSSRFTRQAAEDNFRDSRIASRLAVVNPGVDADYWRNLAAGAERPDSSNLEVLAIGRLTANSTHKGIDRVAQAVGQLHQAGQPVRLTVVGDGPTAPALDGYAEHVTGGAYRRFAAATDGELAGHYVRASVMALPSIPSRVGDRTFVEGFGLVFLEAAACGTPSIGGEHSGGSDAISPGQSGELVDGSVDSIVAALERVLTGESTSSAQSCRAWADANRWETRRDALSAAIFGESERLA